MHSDEAIADAAAFPTIKPHAAIVFMSILVIAVVACVCIIGFCMRKVAEVRHDGSTHKRSNTSSVLELSVNLTTTSYSNFDSKEASKTALKSEGRPWIAKMSFAASNATGKPRKRAQKSKTSTVGEGTYENNTTSNASLRYPSGATAVTLVMASSELSSVTPSKSPASSAAWHIEISDDYKNASSTIKTGVKTRPTALHAVPSLVRDVKGMVVGAAHSSTVAAKHDGGGTTASTSKSSAGHSTRTALTT